MEDFGETLSLFESLDSKWKRAVLKAFFGFDLRDAVRVKACALNKLPEDLSYQEESQKAFTALVKCASGFNNDAMDGECWYETMEMYRAYIPENSEYLIWLELVPVVGSF